MIERKKKRIAREGMSFLVDVDEWYYSCFDIYETFGHETCKKKKGQRRRRGCGDLKIQNAVGCDEL